MKISIFTTIGNEKTDGFGRGDCVLEALRSYRDLADKLIVVSGNRTFAGNYIPDEPFMMWDGVKVHSLDDVVIDDVKIDTVLYNEWPWEWSWEQLPRAMNAGLNACTGDWVIRCDIDYVFHEKDIQNIKHKLDTMSGSPVATFQKFCFVLHDRYYEKGGLPIAINKGLVGDSIKFGQPLNDSTDLCYPIRVTGKNEHGIPEGYYEPDTFAKTGEPVYVYDYSFKTLEQTKEEFWRFAKAYQRYFGDWKFGNSKQKSFDIFINMMKGRLEKCVYQIGKEHAGWVRTHPKYVQHLIDDIKPEQFAHSGWDLL